MLNLFDLSASELLVWGIVLHLVADWLLQSEWMAMNKMLRRRPGSPWYDRHPAAYVHSGIHLLCLVPLLGLGALIVGITHLVIDCRTVIVRWSRMVGQTQPGGDGYDMGVEVRIWTDQVFHVAVVAIAALLCA